ncbi:MAG: Alcohol dehydrogenase [uncultured Sphingomonadaceae bacterium]|uniref:Alcohol dehydrogenase 2 n=1 Tax=uncultured Sphingomonadaceae bacterium TaxID=169976 RepID=A0A6J4TPP3_9SPHN|nr:MAG: Alcohol dehydrogenase [uncultured Sphingomonadaceae bacterium]
MARSFRYGPRVVSGRGAVGELPALLPSGPLLFVTDAGVRAAGLTDAPLAVIGARAIVFDRVEADPSLATLLAAVEAGREAGVAAVVGFGGGSPMDVAKLAAYLLGSGDEVDAIWGVGKAVGRGLPLVLVPTTAGTGSEATPVSVITLPDGEKRGVSSAALVAGHALLDPALTLGLPRAVTAATGIDAMVHAIEATTSRHAKNPLSDVLAREALRLLSANLLTACDRPGDLDAREAMLLGSHLAGVAFANAPVAGVHALAYPLGGRYHLPHGLTNALMLGPVLAFNIEAALDDYAALGVVIDPALEPLGKQGRARGLIQACARLSAASGLPQRLRDVGVARGDLPMLAAEAMRHGRLLVNNPRPIDEADALRLYEAAF